MKHIVISFGTTGILQVANLATGVIAARILLPEGRGELAEIMLWPWLLGAVLFLNLNQAVAYYAAARSEAARRFAAMALLVAAPLAIIAMVIGYAVIPLLMRDASPLAIALGRFYLLYIPVSFVMTIMLATLQGLHRFVGWNFVRVMPSIVYLTGILGLAAFGNVAVTGITLASLAAASAAAAVGLGMVVRLRGPSWQPMPGELRELLRYAVGVHVPALAGICNQQLDKALVALFLPVEQLGIYVVAVSAASIVMMIGATIEPISLARAAHQANAVGRIHVFGRYFRLTLASAGAATILLIVIGKWLVIALYGPAFPEAGQILPMLLFGAFARTITASFYTGLKAIARLRAISAAEYLVLVVQATAMSVLLPRFGLQGAAWSIALSASMGAIVAAIAMSRAANCTVLDLACPTRDDWRYLVKKFSPVRAILHRWTFG